MKIGKVELKNNLILGPMAGVTDLAFRRLCREQGCDLLYTEMVSAKAIHFNNKNTRELLRTEEDESPIAVQIFGSDPKIMAEAARKMEELPFDIIDVNMGCPVPKIVNNNEGSALMKDPKRVEKILTEIVKAVKKPVTVKIRKGFDENTINAVEIAKISENAGVSAIAVHGRTREEYYSGKADWEIIRQVKDTVKIPVIGNGDVNQPEDVKKIMDQTGCDGVMIGRAARGNPWIFSRAREYMRSNILLPSPNMEEIKTMIHKHALLAVQYKGEYTAIREMRKHVAWYTAGLPHSAKIRHDVNQVSTLRELEEIIHFMDCRESGLADGRNLDIM